MRIESLTIVNYRQFKNLNIKFGRNVKNNDLHLLLANNGVGKTNILNAITWCLYGQETHLQDASTAKPILNTAVIDEARKNSLNKEEAYVQLTISTESGKIVFKRTAEFSVSSKVIQLSDKLIIKVPGEGGWETITNEETQSEIKNKYLPQSIFDYIFFDGEHLGKFFSTNQLENVRKGINELTQAEYLRKSAKAINDYISIELEPKLANCNDYAVAQKQKEISNLRKNIDETQKRLDVIETQINICDSEIAKRDKIIHGDEALKDKTDEFKAVEQDIETTENTLAEMKKALSIFIRESYQNIGILSDVNNFYKYIKKQEEEGSLPPSIDKKMLESILEKGVCPVCNNDHVDKNHINHLLSTIKIASKTSSILNKCLGALPGYFNEVGSYEMKLASYLLDIKGLEETLSKLEEKYSILDKFLRQHPDKDEIAKAVEERSQFKKTREDLIEKRGVEANQKAILVKEMSEQDLELQKLLGKKKALKIINDKINFLKKCKAVLEQSHSEVLYDCRREIQDETFRIFDELIWKENEFSKVEIEENYGVILRDKYGEQALGSCSAAETVLLALSFTLALQEISKHDSLLFIDTPVGRVDGLNRRNFMETLMKVARDKQVILTFTPTEYDKNVQEIISSDFSTFTHLNMEDGLTTSTTQA